MKHFTKLQKLFFTGSLCAMLMLSAGCGKSDPGATAASAPAETSSTALAAESTADEPANATTAIDSEDGTDAPFFVDPEAAPESSSTGQTTASEPAAGESQASDSGESVSAESARSQEETDFINRYLGTWQDEEGQCALRLTEIQENQAAFFWNVGSSTRAAEVGFTTGERQGNTVTFTFEDSWGNRGSGTLTLQNDCIHISTDITEPADGARFSAAVDLELSRTEPGSIDDYLIYDSSSRYLSEAELSAFSTEELRLARNEIYARHGRGFSDSTLNEYFSGKFWYIRLYTPENFDARQNELLNEYEQANVDLILRLEGE